MDVCRSRGCGASIIWLYTLRRLWGLIRTSPWPLADSIDRPVSPAAQSRHACARVEGMDRRRGLREINWKMQVESPQDDNRATPPHASQTVIDHNKQKQEAAARAGAGPRPAAAGCTSTFDPTPLHTKAYGRSTTRITPPKHPRPLHRAVSSRSWPLLRVVRSSSSAPKQTAERDPASALASPPSSS